MAIYANMTQPRPTVSGLYSGRSGFGALGVRINDDCQTGTNYGAIKDSDTQALLECRTGPSGYPSFQPVSYAACKTAAAAGKITLEECAGLEGDPNANAENSWAACIRKYGMANRALCRKLKGSGVEGWSWSTISEGIAKAAAEGKVFDRASGTFVPDPTKGGAGTGTGKSAAPAASTAIVALLGGAALWYAFSGKK